MLDRGLVALIEDGLERAHVDGYARIPQVDETVSAVEHGMWAELPWDDE